MTRTACGPRAGRPEGPEQAAPPAWREPDPAGGAQVSVIASVGRVFHRLAVTTAARLGTAGAFAAALGLVVAWLATGPFFHFSNTWQLVINTTTSVVTFLMVFLIQNTQNRDGAAVQAKLDELIRVTEAQNHFIGIEHLTESEVEEIRDKCERAAKRHDKEIAEQAANQAVRKSRAGKKSPAEKQAA